MTIEFPGPVFCTRVFRFSYMDSNGEASDEILCDYGCRGLHFGGPGACWRVVVFDSALFVLECFCGGFKDTPFVDIASAFQIGICNGSVWVFFTYYLVLYFFGESYLPDDGREFVVDGDPKSSGPFLAGVNASKVI